MLLYFWNAVFGIEVILNLMHQTMGSSGIYISFKKLVLKNINDIPLFKVLEYLNIVNNDNFYLFILQSGMILKIK